MTAAFTALAESLGYVDGTGQLERALTHKSFSNEDGAAADNERLEFLGDAVVGLVVADGLMAAHPDAPEGVLSRLRSTIVNARNLAQCARGRALGRTMRLGRGEELTGGRDKDSLLADVYEAVVGAVFQDLGLEAARIVILQDVGQAIRTPDGEGQDRDFKTMLQELVQARHQVVPTYRVVQAEGPDHAKEFTVDVTIDGVVIGTGAGRSKKSAERVAAEAAYAKISSGPWRGAGDPASAGTQSPSPACPPEDS